MAYELYLIRHGLAEERGEKWPDDTKRPLTERGMARLRRQGRGIRRLGVIFDVVLTSPLARARQTAEIAASWCDPRPHVVNVEALAPGGAYAALLGELQKQSRRSAIALVGHEPDLGEMGARLIGSRHPLDFKKGAICRIDVESLPPEGPGTLRWFLTPKILRLIR